MRLLVASALAALALAGPAAADVRPHLRLASTEPPIVRGGGFHGHERVTVIARQNRGARLVRHATATGGGTFKVTFPGATPPCGNFRVTATGSMGSRAVLPGMMLPDCMIR